MSINFLSKLISNECSMEDFMKKVFRLFFYQLLLTVVLASCATSITVAKQVDSYEIESVNTGKPIMEFIGYKGDSNILSTTSETKNSFGKVLTVMSPFDQWKAINQTDALRNMGTTLQNKNIAIDKSFAYFGIYSLQELELYKSQSRYVTFIEVAKNQYTINDNGNSKNWFGAFGGASLGSGLLFNILGAAIPEKENHGYYTSDNSILKSYYQGYGIGLDVAGLILLLPAISKSKTTSKFEGVYNVYVYDTQLKEIIYKDSVSISSSDSFEGSYFYDDASKRIVHEYYGKIISNALLKKYDEINKMLVLRKN